MNADSTASDAEASVDRVIEEARRGQNAALGECLDHCRNYLLLVANEELPADVQQKVAPSDLVQETFLEAKQSFSRFRGNSEKDLLAWLRSILLHNLIDVTRQFRHSAKRAVSREHSLDDAADAPAGSEELVDPLPSPSWAAMAGESQRRLEEALARLPPHYAQAIELRNLQRHSFAMIGQALGLSENGARKLWSRAVQALLADWKEEDDPR